MCRTIRFIGCATAGRIAFLRLSQKFQLDERRMARRQKVRPNFFLPNFWTRGRVGNMKPRVSHQKTAALTLVEVLVVICVIAVLVVILGILLPALTYHGISSRPDPCHWNQRQITLAFRVWAGDHGDKYPMQLSTANWGAKELALNGDVAGIFCTMSNELSTPKYLFCPFDKKGKAATDFGSGFNRTHVNYFVGIDTELKSPSQMILTGDDNLLVKGNPISFGLLSLSTNASVTWTKERHDGTGFVGFADGSVLRVDGAGLQQTFQSVGVATNRLAIP
jgi:hypothetical protein